MKGHVAIPAKDIASSTAFYKVFGFFIEQEYSKPDSGLHIIRMKNDEDFILELMSPPASTISAINTKPELLHLGFPVRNLEETLEKLQALDVEIVIPITEGIAVRRYAFVKDPNGFSIEIFENKTSV